MKVLVLYHTLWMEQLAECWSSVGKIEVETLPLPTADWDNKPELKEQIADIIPEYIAACGVDWVLDVNGAGVLPMGGGRWTCSESPVPWVEWWWDDPSIYAARMERDGVLEPWLRAILSGKITHFSWDLVLAGEYSHWFASYGKVCHFLPTATHPGVFCPDAARQTQNLFGQFDVSFLGTFYDADSQPPAGERDTLEYIVRTRLDNPGKSYVEMADGAPNGSFRECFAGARPEKFFSGNFFAWRHLADAGVGRARRGLPLSNIAKRFPSRFFIGDNMPTMVSSDVRRIWMPSNLVGLYRACAVNLDMGNGQSFTGTNMRCYEIMACGGILAGNRRPDFDPAGELDGDAYFTFSSVDELASLVEWVRGRPNDADKVRMAARELVSQHHSWANRLVSITKVLSS